MATEPGSRERPKRSRPNINDVAKRAGVSRATASRVLGGYGYSSQEVIERVNQAVRELGYEPDRIARTMRSGKSDVIGFVCADISDAFFSAAMRGICDVALREGSQVIVMNTDDRGSQERQATKVLLSHKVDGIIITPVSVREHGHIDAVTRAGVPVVSLDRQLSDSGIDSVVADNEAATAAAIDHLIGLGHRRVAFLGSVQPEEPPALRIGKVRASVAGPSRPSHDRVRGYLRALSAAGLHPDRDLIALVPHDEPKRRMHAVQTMLELEDPPTALFTADSYMTKSAFSLLSERGIAIPGDISLLGFDDLEWTTLVRPRISVVVQPSYEMGRAAAEQLFAQIGRNAAPDTDPRGRRTVVPARFLERDSVAPSP
ncbi:LacI family transcriptional regulator [Actinoallomurus spadix]|uniref:LacI family DNA-binding transcriptional regulator n=1 Tax=Actinoallomurus spadix TaxID=79912 RepID=A0ABN0WJ86_9ACTN|nr:LacI family DNA-binding transcriptional regulator [Actinoallomurus spadix]MCO5990564.1 LacI family transcriptional regulator [Actinoallomurus spadix]